MIWFRIIYTFTLFYVRIYMEIGQKTFRPGTVVASANGGGIRNPSLFNLVSLLKRVNAILTLDVGAKGLFVGGAGMAVVDNMCDLLPMLLLEHFSRSRNDGVGRSGAGIDDDGAPTMKSMNCDGGVMMME
ncbi:hypothetical protein VNO78_05235 [Psophocarpus tetragonolobus]|uniref:Uncharacterized protein n=1 Tax=Psophocarpus tetragonolobus TaxID=3891 RepID=A0AAN9XRB0_PSOTE